MRTLPEVDGTLVVDRFLARHRATIRAGAAFVGVAVMLLGALALSASVIRTEVLPEIDHLVAVHQQGADELDSGRVVLDGLPNVERRSTWDRVHDACARLTQTFAGGG